MVQASMAQKQSTTLLPAHEILNNWGGFWMDVCPLDPIRAVTFERKGFWKEMISMRSHVR